MSQERMNNDENRVKTPALGAAMPTPGISHVLTRTQKALDKVRVVHGANTKHFDLSGKTVGSVRKSLREAFNIPSEAEALVDGKSVGDDFILQGGQNLEFNKEAGIKG